MQDIIKTRGNLCTEPGPPTVLPYLTTEMNFTKFFSWQDFQNFNPVVIVGAQNGLEIAFQSFQI